MIRLALGRREEPMPDIAPLEGMTRLVVLSAMLIASLFIAAGLARAAAWLLGAHGPPLTPTTRAMALSFVGGFMLVAVACAMLLIFELAAPRSIRRAVLLRFIRWARRRRPSHLAPSRRDPRWPSAWAMLRGAVRAIGIASFGYITIGLALQALAAVGAPQPWLGPVHPLFGWDRLTAAATLLLMCAGTLGVRARRDPMQLHGAAP